ncbi:hypothetical protein BGZ49_009891 [Haplosporangium sp. Z 27]|nr:hypothetical protein BGZ49_009891 [Haplosporangium sp. Z 27]
MVPNDTVHTLDQGLDPVHPPDQSLVAIATEGMALEIAATILVLEIGNHIAMVAAGVETGVGTGADQLIAAQVVVAAIGKRHRRRSPSSSDESDGNPRSVITGQKLKLKIAKSSKDKKREKNRGSLLEFLNASYD